MNTREIKRGSINRLLRRTSRHVWVFLVACVLGVLAIGCTVVESQYYALQPGNCALYAYIFQKPSSQILKVHDSICKKDIKCTTDLLRKHIELKGWGAAEWNQALREDGASLKSSLDRIRSGKDKCLVLKKDICPPNLNNTSFESRGASGACKVGKKFGQ